MPATTLLTLTESLAGVTTAGAKSKLSRELSQELARDPDGASLVLHSLVMEVLREVPGLEAVVESDFYKVRHKAYKDDDGYYKVALGLAYLQSYLGFTPDLDQQVLNHLLTSIYRRNLDFIVNDVTVNLMQVRNGEIGSLL